MIENQLLEATSNLIEQQFYKSGEDIIVGRTPEISLKISNSGQVIRKFKDLFNDNLDLFLEGDYLKFLNLFKKIKGIDENYIHEIYQDLQLKFETIEGVDTINIVVLYTMVLNSLISIIRDLNFGETIKEIKKRIKKKINLNNSTIQAELDKLFMKNDKNVSILYNISYLDTLAESFNYKKVAHICKIQKGKYINRIVKLIIEINKQE
ncbi:MAG: hypothetical protein ACFE91_09690 [Promethearchaeota archaeon]